MEKRKEICSLRNKEAIEAIQNENEVFYKSGVWNNYSLVPVETAIKGIEASGYGADVWKGLETGMYYVSCPSRSDMW